MQTWPIKEIFVCKAHVSPVKHHHFFKSLVTEQNLGDLGVCRCWAHSWNPRGTASGS